MIGPSFIDTCILAVGGLAGFIGITRNALRAIEVIFWFPTLI